MIFDVAIPIDGFEKESAFKFEKIDDFFSVITAQESQKQLRLMSFGALKSLSFEFPEEFISKMQISSLDDISIFYIFVLQNDSQNNSLNTFSPVIINHKTNTIGQVHLDLEELGLTNLVDIIPKF